MAKYAIIENNIVRNVIEATSQSELEFLEKNYNLIEIEETSIVQMGDYYYNNKFITIMDIQNQILILNKLLKENLENFNQLSERLHIIEKIIYQKGSPII